MTPLACAECCRGARQVPDKGQTPSRELDAAITIMNGDALCSRHARARVSSISEEAR